MLAKKHVAGEITATRRDTEMSGQVDLEASTNRNGSKVVRIFSGLWPLFSVLSTHCSPLFITPGPAAQ
jgi:hypothetical protein